MTASDIIHVVTIVAITQAFCDLVSRKLVYSQEPYKRAISSFGRTKWKYDRAMAAAAVQQKQKQEQKSSKPQSSTSIKNAEKSAKKLKRIEDDYNEAVADITKRHTPSQVITSLIFVILYRVLSLEYEGKVVAVLPFQPWSIVRRMSLRTLNVIEFMADSDESKVSHGHQACAFLFVYVLSTMSVKFFVNKVVGAHPPKGADKGLSAMLDDPQSQRFLKGLGLDTDELKKNGF
jgi:uncharacterized membrane protein (DUF106 family)